MAQFGNRRTRLRKVPMGHLLYSLVTDTAGEAEICVLLMRKVDLVGEILKDMALEAVLSLRDGGKLAMAGVAVLLALEPERPVSRLALPVADRAADLR